MKVTSILRSLFFMKPEQNNPIAIQKLNRLFHITDQIDNCTHLLKKNTYDALFLDLSLIKEYFKDTISEVEQLNHFLEIQKNIQIVILVEPQQIQASISYIKAGAQSYLPYPITEDELGVVNSFLEKQQNLKAELHYLREDLLENDIGPKSNSERMKGVLENAIAVSDTSSTVLIMGETGTGKNILANLIHSNSRRKHNAFVNIHCGAIPDNLLESELFGHEKGAFTGAVKEKRGKFEIANGGTLFLDEIGTISMSMQIKLLKVLQEKSYVRVGGEQEKKTDVRVIAATNESLKTMCENGTFRWDLYYRLNVFQIEIPPLRNRMEDLGDIVKNILDKLNKSNYKSIETVEPDTLKALASYSWPGNIRELENIIERAFILEKSNTLTLESLPVELIISKKDANNISIPSYAGTLEEFRKVEVARIEKSYLNYYLEQTLGSISKTAEQANISTRYLHKLMTRYNLNKKSYKH